MRSMLPTLLLLSASGIAAAMPPAVAERSVPVRTNAIVGLWQIEVSLRPCANPAAPEIAFTALQAFHAGGTLSDFNASPPASRSPGMGIWSHLGGDQYRARFQFFRFVNGAFDGVQDIETQTTLAPGGDYYSSVVHARVLNVDGSVRVELCGSADAERVGFE